ncbi:MAG: hypothetical protein VX519_00095 [Myxococcota bacterium]|nr:hypothetical protein [Myxococcota bacterium]
MQWMKAPSLMLALMCVWSSDAPAKQLEHGVQRSADSWTISVRWADAEGHTHRAEYELPTLEVRRDMNTPLKFRKAVAARYMAKEINKEMAGFRGVKINAWATNSGVVRIKAKGKDGARVKEAIRQASEAQEAALERYMAEHGYTYLGKKIVPDHARHVAEYAQGLASVVEALGGPTPDPRDFSDLALAFVQTIPYERRARVADLYRRPISVLGRNKGDCDSKTVLFLALMRQAYPSLPLAIVYIPGHAFGAIGIDPARGDARLRRRGETWVGVEPVGPAVHPAGELGRKSRKRARLGLYRIKVVQE